MTAYDGSMHPKLSYYYIKVCAAMGKAVAAKLVIGRVLELLTLPPVGHKPKPSHEVKCLTVGKRLESKLMHFAPLAFSPDNISQILLRRTTTETALSVGQLQRSFKTSR